MMDKQPKMPTRASGIPRPVSRLPLPTTTASKSLKPSPSREKLQADTGLDIARLRRPSEEGIFKKPALPRPSSSLKKPQEGRSGTEPVDDRSTLDTNDTEYETEARGREGPSLSDRTVETLAQSSTPSRRQSSFFNATSPIRFPSRPPSSLTNYSRSPSRSSTSRQQSGDSLLTQPASTTRLPSRSRVPAAPSLSTNGISFHQDTIAAVDSPSKPKRPSRTCLYDGAKSTGVAMLKPRRPLSKQFTKPAEPDTEAPSQVLQVKKTRKVPSNPSISMRSPTSTESRKSSTVSTTQVLSQEQQSEVETRKVSKSSNALRESIAKAKAARKAASQNISQNTSQDKPQTAPVDPFDVPDPFNQQPKDSNLGLLRKRVESGLTTGHLNIAAMSLTELPKEVLTMYDFDPESSTDWYESVDLVKMIAADNGLAELPDFAFPDIDPQNIDLDSDQRGYQFGGLEALDLHGNLFRSLPIGLRRLHRLHSLNLSNNQLSIDDLQVVWEIESLRDLKLAKNQLQGEFPSAISQLRNLEVLDLHENSITGLPEDIKELTSLRLLDVGQNQLATLRFDALRKLPLKEIRASKNKLIGSLMPASVQQFETLQNLDVVSNQLERLSDNEPIDLPNLQTLSINVNRIKALPNVSTWQELRTLSVEENRLTEIPPGFVELKNVRNVDFTGNDISQLDEKIGLMENLVTFRIANNPLRERKFLSMVTDDIKRDLRNRCEPEVQQDTDDEEGSVATQFTLAPESPAAQTTTAWQVRPGGVLDRSYTDMQELETSQLEAIPNSQDIRSLYLQHNELQGFPISGLSMLSTSLIDLDLSHNPLNSSTLLSSSLSLPNLQNLILSATGLTTIEPLLTNLAASHLTHLDISSNRLSGSLPRIRETYPALKTLLAADNQFDDLEFEAVRGLQVLDIGNNNINSLPPKIGLLRAEGSSKNWGCGSALRRFEVAGNTFRIPRWQTVAKGTDAVLEWLKDRLPPEELRELESGDEEDFAE